MLLLLFPSLCISQWSSDPMVNTPICTAGYQQTGVKMVRYDGGALVFWGDLRNSHGEIPGNGIDDDGDGITDSDPGYEFYGQKLRNDGTMEWAAQGVSLSACEGGCAWELSYDCAPDGSGGACIVYTADVGYGDYRLYALRVNASGSVVWSRTICNVSCDADPRIVETDSGHVMVIWTISSSVRLQKVGTDGAIHWAANGIQVCNTTGSRSNPRIVEDGQGGAVFAWDDTRNGNDDVFAQRVDSSGATKWATNGIAVCTATGSQSPCELAYAPVDSSFYIVWDDQRGSDWDIYGQRLSLNGTMQWSSNGIGICTATGDQTNVQITIGKNGATAYTTWQDHRGTDNDIYGQRLDASGPIWTANGIVICDASGAQSNPVIAPTNEIDGAIICWSDARGSDIDIYGQKVDSDGNILRPSNGEVLSNASGNQTTPAVVGDGSDGAIVAWTDSRNSSVDIYTQRMLSDLVLPIELISFFASFDDGTIKLQWSTVTEVNSYGFEIQRRTGKNSEWNAIGFAKAAGASSTPHEYVFRDQVVTANLVEYRLKQMDTNGGFTYSNSVSIKLVPDRFSLSYNYPNPFNPRTRIDYALPVASYVTITIFNALGQEVAEFVKGEKEAGYYSLSFDGTRLASGVYVYRMRAGSFVQTKKMLLLK